MPTANLRAPSSWRTSRRYNEEVSTNVILVLRVKRVASPPGDTVANVRTDGHQVAMKLAMQEKSYATFFAQAIESMTWIFTKSSHTYRTAPSRSAA
jgi:hypothetical protein